MIQPVSSEINYVSWGDTYMCHGVTHIGGHKSLKNNITGVLPFYDLNIPRFVHRFQGQLCPC